MQCYEHSLTILDTLLCLFVFSPLSIMHWRGTWNLQELYLTPANPLPSMCLSAALGVGGCTAAQLIQPAVLSAAAPANKSTCGRVLHFMVCRVYLYALGWFIMCYWRGLWDLTDYYLSEGWLNSLLIYALCQTGAVALRTCRAQVGLPLSISLDTDSAVYQPDTRFKTKVSRGWWFILDVVFTQFVIVSMSVLIWRGLWNLMEATIYPHNPLMADLACSVIGYTILTSMLLLGAPSARVSRELESRGCFYAFLLFEDLLMIIGTIGVVFLWKGGESLWSLKVFPGTAQGSWMAHILGSLGLLVTQTFSNVGTNGVDVDGTFSAGSGLYNTHYCRYYLRRYLAGNSKQVSVKPVISGLKDLHSESDEIW